MWPWPHAASACRSWCLVCNTNKWGTLRRQLRTLSFRPGLFVCLFVMDKGEQRREGRGAALMTLAGFEELLSRLVELEAGVAKAKAEETYRHCVSDVSRRRLRQLREADAAVGVALSPVASPSAHTARKSVRPSKPKGNATQPSNNSTQVNGFSVGGVTLHSFEGCTQRELYYCGCLSGFLAVLATSPACTTRGAAVRAGPVRLLLHRRAAGRGAAEGAAGGAA